MTLTELAKELNIAQGDLVSALKDLGVPIDGPATSIDSETANTVRELLAKGTGASRSTEVSDQPTVKEIAEAVGVEPAIAQRKLVEMGELVGINQRLPRPTAERLAAAYGFALVIKEAAPAARSPQKPPRAAGPARPPVVTVMGHVDHGKTTLLDSIREGHVVAGEFGGITQHIGAYQVEVDHEGQKRRITFLDTPGHAAFTAMRARGARVTDIVVLVVAADDGIMPQTVEAINHAQAAGVPIIVAINKIDLQDAEPDRVKQQLTEHNLVVEQYGGDVIAVPVSAKTGSGVGDLLDYILLVADVNELTADPAAPATGTVIEATLEQGRGAVATILVQSGTLRVGDNLVAGTASGRVRAMFSDRGERLTKATPSTPVVVLGLGSVPNAGDAVEVVRNEKEARQIVDRRQVDARAARLVAPPRATMADLLRQSEEGPVKDMNLVVKADVQGSLEAVVNQIEALDRERPDEEVRISIKHSGIGNINESDVVLAHTTDSFIVGFNVRTDAAAQRAAERHHTVIRSYRVIYELVDEIDKARKGMLTPIYEEAALGKAEIRKVFKTPRGVFIAGCFVTEGKLVRGAQVRVRRGADVLVSSQIDTLRHVKDDVREMAQGFECGATVDDWNDLMVGDVLECFELRQVERS